MYYNNNKLFIDKILVDKIIKKFGSPIYCYSYNRLKENILKFQRNFSKINPLICFAVKANNNITILNEIGKLGLGADVVSKGELMAAIKAKINRKKIVFSGVGKTYEEIEFAIKNRILLINAESKSEIENIIKIAKKKKIKVIEDAAEAFLSKNKKKYLGTIGDMGCFSLSPNKIFTSGQGGLLVTNNKKYFDKIKVFKTQGRVGITSGGDDLHISKGGNFKLSNISAGLALSQLSYIYKRKKKLIQNYKIYKKNLNLKQIKILKFDVNNKELPLWTDVVCDRRDKLYNYLKKNNIICRKFWFPLSKKNFYSNQKHSSFKNTKKIENKIMWLPSSFLMKKKDQLTVIKKIKNFYQVS